MTPEDARQAKLRELAALKAAALNRLRAEHVTRARDNLLPFAQHMMPDLDSPNDPRRSEYVVTRHHKAISGILEAVERQEFEYVVIVIHPRSGKTQLVSKFFPAWVAGRNPTKDIIVATYSDEYAQDLGRAVRSILRNDRYKEVFPGVDLQTGSASADRLETTAGGQMHFVGRGTGLTGRGGDIMLLDDPMKDRAEADSPTIRERAWTWFTQVFLTRRMQAGRPAVLVTTRWHSDDLVGRLTDPNSAHYDATLAQKIHVFHLPAIAGENDMLGRSPGEVLWPERFPLSYLDDLRRMDPRGFSALWQGEPTPDEGDHFKSDWLHTYRLHQLPPLDELHVYVTSDHAVGLKQANDRTCLLPFGIDRNDVLWVLPDVWWQRGDAETQINAMINIIDRLEPMRWWGEKGHILQSIGPALNRQMRAKRAFTTFEMVTPVQDKVQRSRAIQARLSMGRVRFPIFAPWWAQARSELLTFPYGQHDDFVDALALAGLKTERLIAPRKRQPLLIEGAKPGTLAWVKENSKHEARLRDARLQGGW
jgi:predicted phage terminase large subunit-like protein